MNMVICFSRKVLLRLYFSTTDNFVNLFLTAKFHANNHFAKRIFAKMCRRYYRYAFSRKCISDISPKSKLKFRMYFVATLPSAPPLSPLLLQDLGLELGLELPEDVLRGLHVPWQRVHLRANFIF